jgi:DNA-binding NarL/FixJ family response regulator
MSRPIVRIMIVDDHISIRRGVRSLIESRPCFQVVGEAEDGFQAVEVAAQTKPDVAILDYCLPKRNGLALSQALKLLLPRLEVVLFTMHDREELVADLLRAGIRGFVLKSEPGEHLLDAIDSVSLHRSYFSQTVSETLINHVIDRKPDAGTCLTRREREVVQLVAEGSVNKQVAHSLDISVKTVETHRAAAMRKLNLGTTADLVRFAIRNQIVAA